MKLFLRALPLAIALLVPSAALAETPGKDAATTGTAKPAAAKTHPARTAKRAKAAKAAKPKKAVKAKATKATKAPKAAKKAPKASKKAAK